MPNFPKKLPQKVDTHFIHISDIIRNIPKTHQNFWATFVSDNFLPRTCKKRPIWSHWPTGVIPSRRSKVFAPDDPDVIVSIVNADADVAFVYDRSKGEDEDADGEVDDSIAVIVSDRLLPIFRILLKNGPIQASFCFFVLFSLQFQ